MKILTACLLGVLGSLFWGRSALGAEVLLIQFQEAEIQIYRQDFEEMALTGALPSDIKSILGENFQIPPDIQQILSRPIKLPSTTREFLDSDTGEFLLQRMDKLISSTSGQQTENLSFLRTAFTEAADQQQVALLDLIRQYPQQTVKVNLTGLVQTYEQVLQFVDNIKAESNPTRQFLADLLCNCPQAQSASPTPSTIQASQANCVRQQSHITSENRGTPK